MCFIFRCSECSPSDVNRTQATVTVYVVMMIQGAVVAKHLQHYLIASVSDLIQCDVGNVTYDAPTLIRYVHYIVSEYLTMQRLERYGWMDGGHCLG